MRATPHNQQGSLSFALKEWDSDFFGRQIRELTLNGPLNCSELEAALSRLDQEGVWGIEIRVDPDRMSDIPKLEDAGFRLVDSKMSFVSHLTTSSIDQTPLPFGTLRQVERADLPRVCELTIKNLIDNPTVYSRYKDSRLFTREESIRYYNAWNQRAFLEQPELFAVWEINGNVGAFFNYMRVNHRELNPMFKGILTAVAPEYRGRNAHNIMQSFLFKRFGESEWWIDNTTQVSNTPVIRNHIRAGKDFHGASIVLFRVRATMNV